MLHNAMIILVNSRLFKVLYLRRGKILSGNALHNTDGTIDILMDKHLESKFAQTLPIYFILYEEEMMIRELMIPRCSISTIPTVLEQEFAYEFNDVSNIINCYEIIDKQPKILELLVYYFKMDKVPIIKEYLNSGKYKVKGIFSSQLLIFNHFRNKIRTKNYLLIHLEDNILYMIGVVKNNVFKCQIIDLRKDKASYTGEIDQFVKALPIYNKASGVLEVYHSIATGANDDIVLESESFEFCSIKKLKYKGILEIAAIQL